MMAPSSSCGTASAAAAAQQREPRVERRQQPAQPPQRQPSSSSSSSSNPAAASLDERLASLMRLEQQQQSSSDDIRRLPQFQSLRDDLTCQICGDVYKIPVRLRNCGHAFCCWCAMSALRRQLDTKMILDSRCPAVYCAGKAHPDKDLRADRQLELAADRFRRAFFPEREESDGKQQKLSALDRAGKTKKVRPIYKLKKRNQLIELCKSEGLNSWGSTDGQLIWRHSTFVDLYNAHCCYSGLPWTHGQVVDAVHNWEQNKKMGWQSKCNGEGDDSTVGGGGDDDKMVVYDPVHAKLQAQRIERIKKCRDAIGASDAADNGEERIAAVAPAPARLTSGDAEFDATMKSNFAKMISFLMKQRRRLGKPIPPHYTFEEDEDEEEVNEGDGDGGDGLEEGTDDLDRKMPAVDPSVDAAAAARADGSNRDREEREGQACEEKNSAAAANNDVDGSMAEEEEQPIEITAKASALRDDERPGDDDNGDRSKMPPAGAKHDSQFDGDNDDDSVEAVDPPPAYASASVVAATAVGSSSNRSSLSSSSGRNPFAFAASAAAPSPRNKRKSPEGPAGENSRRSRNGSSTGRRTGSANVAAAASITQQPGGDCWNCPRCTFRNEKNVSRRATCELCEKKRPVPSYSS